MTITVDRDDRPVLSEFCYKQLERMKGLDFENQSARIHYPPRDEKCDIVPRMQIAIQMGGRLPRKDGTSRDGRAEWAFIIENDDFYPADYLEKIMFPGFEQYDFIGWQNTFYYNIKTRRYSRLEHETHSSLFCTGFRLSALDDFEWPPDDYPFLDIALWKHAKQSGKNWKLLRTDNPCVGIKGHGMGKMGGKGHRMELIRADPEMKWFREKLNDEEAFKFYQSIV